MYDDRSFLFGFPVVLTFLFLSAVEFNVASSSFVVLLLTGDTAADADEPGFPQFEPGRRFPLHYDLHTDWNLQGPYLCHKEG